MRMGPEGQLRGIGLCMDSSSTRKKEKGKRKKKVVNTLDPLRDRRCMSLEGQLRASKEKARSMGPTGLGKAQNQAHPNWAWDQLAKRNQEAWDPLDRQKLKTRLTPIHLGSSRKEKARSMEPIGLAKAQNQAHPN
ncbi:hypothetical protein L3X38_001007 [Prunus dulcis]|uniref:Uncharacterized protein n=1 Tax=Prunus dulcis TaxID=3755 RepID=A0AAD4WR81_PRUDU|nr:hypothetical protein L3X38_001007 [Prunus dulcis]